MIGLGFRDIVIEKVFEGLKSTRHSLANACTVCRSLFNKAARSGVSTVMYRLVSSANRRMLVPI